MRKRALRHGLESVVTARLDGSDGQLELALQPLVLALLHVSHFASSLPSRIHTTSPLLRGSPVPLVNSSKRSLAQLLSTVRVSALFGQFELPVHLLEVQLNQLRRTWSKKTLLPSV